MDQPLAVIFDMDGVLVDTYQAHYRSWRHMAEAHGLTFSEEDFARGFGRTSREIIETQFNHGQLTPDQMAAMDAEKEAAFRRIIEEDFPEMPGARRLIETLRAAGFKLAVGSSAPPENVALSIEKLGVGRLLGATVHGQDVTRGKPDPQVFLLGAERLGAEPERCVVIEDAGAGVDAAHAAGMACVGLASTGRTRESLADAELVVDSLDELSPEALEALIRSRHVR